MSTEEGGSESNGDPRTYAIIGAAIEVHRHLGHGFLESVYQEALALEMTARGVSFDREAELPVRYKGQILARSYRADFICFDEIIVELKAIRELTEREHSQILHYLKATGLSLGLLINFGSTRRLETKRFIRSLPSA
jgi:GxxExxY protein